MNIPVKIVKQIEEQANDRRNVLFDGTKIKQ